MPISLPAEPSASPSEPCFRRPPSRHFARGLVYLILLLCLAPLACAQTGGHPPASVVPAAEEPAAGSQTPIAGSTTVILVRHAEKEKDAGRDPALTAAGESRAQTLVHALGNLDIAAIYSTPWRRTRGTAAPIAETLGLDVRIVETDEGYISRMAQIAQRDHPGQTILVVGHSNTTPDLARALGASDAPEIPDHQYDDLWIVRLEATSPKGDSGAAAAADPGQRDASLLRLRYGAATPGI